MGDERGVIECLTLATMTLTLNPRLQAFKSSDRGFRTGSGESAMLRHDERSDAGETLRAGGTQERPARHRCRPALPAQGAVSASPFETTWKGSGLQSFGSVEGSGCGGHRVGLWRCRMRAREGEANDKSAITLS